MPGKIKVKILAGRNLPVMDKSGDTTDGYVEIKFGCITYKTDVCRKTLNPQWNSEWYRFEVDDAELQDEPLQIRLMDHDTYSANDAIGKVYINLNPLLLPGLPLTVKNIWTLEATINSSTGSQGGSVMAGWIPVFDTMHGIRGEVNIIVKVELFSDFNKFKQSSCGVQFFYSPNIPHGYHAQVIHGFVEELIVSDDPEYKWIDKIRTPRASNEARQTLFLKLSGEVQRKIGLKALDLGGNAVIGYIQTFDLEGESGIVARGIGTAVTLVKLHDAYNLPMDSVNVEDLACFSLQNKNQFECSESDDSVPLLSHSPSHSPISSRSPVRIQKTRVGNKFPMYEKAIKNSYTTSRIFEINASSMKSQIGSLQNSPISSFKKVSRIGGGSSLSLSDDLICESSLRSMLALEDMRGERTSAFSRGLKNLRYLPKRVIQMKSKFSESFDDESDQDSNYSSSWSIVGGSDLTRSSISDFRQSMRRKKFTHKRNTTESTSGIAALLIRSVHTGFPLDSVKEDRETPTPSPIHFLGNRHESLECSAIPLKCIIDADSDEIPEKSEIRKNATINKSDEFTAKVKEKPFDYNDKINIPMISSSESDTSTSEDDEPSESSTNYNILDDSLSVNDSTSPENIKIFRNNSSKLINKSSFEAKENNSVKSTTPIPCLPTSNDQVTDICDHEYLDLTTSKSFVNHHNSPPEGLILDSVISQEEVFVPLIPSVPSTPEEFIDAEYSMLSLSNTSLRTTPSFKLKILGKQKGFDNEDILFPDATSTPVRERKNFFVSNMDLESVSSPNQSLPSAQPFVVYVVPVLNDPTSEQQAFDQEKNSISMNHELANQNTNISAEMSKQIVLSSDKLKKIDQKTKIKHEKKTSSSTSSPLPYKKYLINRSSLEGKYLSEKKEKTSKKVTRTDTVIYKGPVKEKEKPCIPTNHKDNIGKITKINCASAPINIPPTIIIAPPSQPDCYLRVPTPDPIIMNVHTPCSSEDTKLPANPVTIDQPNHVVCTGSQLTNDRIIHEYRQHCMFDLIKTIDARMMIHAVHNERKDSIKSKRKHRDHGNLNLTPSPDSIHKSRLHQKNSLSKSPPEKHHHRHHHHHHHHSSNHSHQLSPLAIPNSNSDIHSQNTLTCPQLKSLRETDVSSCDSSSEYLPHSNTNVILNDNPQSVMYKRGSMVDCNNSTCNLRIFDDNINEINHELAANNFSLKCLDDETVNGNSDEIKMSTMKPNNFRLLLNPNEIDSSVHKSHSEGSLGKLNNNHSPLTYIANNANNFIDNPCVPCFPITPRQQEDQEQQQQQQSTSPSHPASSSGLTAPCGSKAVNSPATKTPLHRRSSDSDLSITPKGNSLAGSDRSMAVQLRPSTAIRTMNQDALEMLEYPFITIQQYPPGFILNLGGLVSARSVKLIEKLNNLEEPEGRDAWWTEIRMEVRSHARALCCNVVLGYREEISICDDVCVLNASGTAAVINLFNSSQDQDIFNRNMSATIVSSIESEKGQQKPTGNKSEKDDSQITLPPPPPPPLLTQQQQINPSMGKITRISEYNIESEVPIMTLQNSCNYCHLPYSETNVPFKVEVSKCGVCRRAKVPDVLFTTIELPDNIPITGRGVFLQATVCKCKRDLRGELNAKEISDCLPFLEYELHSLLLNKLKVKGMNAIFGLKVQISIGERLIVGMAVGTAVFLTALPTPLVPKIASGNSWHNDEQLAEIQRALIETVRRNRELYYLKPTISGEVENGRSVAAPQISDTDESDDDLPDLDLGVGTKDACVLEVDDVEDMDRINLLMDENPPDDFHVVNTQTIPGLDDLEIVRNLQMFTQVSRAKIPSGQYASMPSKYFARMLQTVFFKLRRMVPCALCDMQFKVALTDQDEIQLSVVGMALGLGEPTRIKNKYKRNNNKGIINNTLSRDLSKKFDDNHLIFKLDEDQAENNFTNETTINQQIQQQMSTGINASPAVSQIQKPNRPRSPLKSKTHVQLQRHKHVPLKERYGVDITPLSYLPGGRIERYLGNLNFFFIRECTSIRESGGLSGFTHSFITEVLAICRAHITALGGNAMVAFFMTQCELVHSPHKNQGQCLINVGGDVVSVSYFGGERLNQNC